MDKVLTSLCLALIVVGLAGPALGQEPDPYGDVLPRDAVQPDDLVAPPDGRAAPPGRAAAPGDVSPDGGAAAPGAANRGGRSGPGQIEAAQDAVDPVADPATVFGRQLPATGDELTIGLLVLGAFMVAGGAVAVARARIRVNLPQE